MRNEKKNKSEFGRDNRENKSGVRKKSGSNRFNENKAPVKKKRTGGRNSSFGKFDDRKKHHGKRAFAMFDTSFIEVPEDDLLFDGGDDFEEFDAFEDFDKKEKKEKRKKSQSRCPVFSLCGACKHIDVPYEEQLEEKHKKLKRLLGKYGKIDPVVGMKDPHHYRCKVTATFKQKYDGTVEAGNFSEGSRKVVPVKKCYLEDPVADRIIQSVADLIKSFKMKVYNEKNGYGLIRYCMVRVGKNTGEIMVIIVTRSPVFPSKNNFVKALREKHPEITTIVQNVNDRTDSMILGPRDNVLYGKGYITDKLCGKTFRLSPRSFYQVNPVQTEFLYKKAVSLAGLTGKETVLDAYCGTGTIGIIAADNAGKVIGVELSPDAVKDAHINIKQNDVPNLTNGKRPAKVEVYQGDAGEFLEEYYREGGRVDTVIMDPPRAGSSDEFIGTLRELLPDKIVYVSCNPVTLARDLEKLTEYQPGKAGYFVKTIAPFDMFPFTDHVETVVLLSQQKSDDHIEIEINLDEIDATSAETKATYKEIEEWVHKHYGFHVTNLNIAQVKQKHGIIERENYNKPKSENSKQPGCPEEKVKAIEEALKHFQMI